jgi:hypothetical protein
MRKKLMSYVLAVAMMAVGGVAFAQTPSGSGSGPSGNLQPSSSKFMDNISAVYN